MFKNQGGNVSAELILVLAVAILGMYGIWKMASNDVAADEEVLSNHKATNKALMSQIDRLEEKINLISEAYEKQSTAQDNLWTKYERLEKFAGANKLEIDGIKEGKKEFKRFFQEELHKIDREVEVMPAKLELFVKKAIPVHVSHQVGARTIVERSHVKKTKTGYTRTTRKRVLPYKKKKAHQKRKRVKKAKRKVASH